VFTTHTAVDAGFDRFAPDLIRQYLPRYAQDELRIPLQDLVALGRVNREDQAEPFNMAHLAIRGSGSQMRWAACTGRSAGGSLDLCFRDSRKLKCRSAMSRTGFTCQCGIRRERTNYGRSSAAKGRGAVLLALRRKSSAQLTTCDSGKCALRVDGRWSSMPGAPRGRIRRLVRTSTGTGRRPQRRYFDAWVCSPVCHV
jgi:hypothetical protein